MLEVFRCTECGKIAMITHDGPGQMVWCGQPMTRAGANVVDARRTTSPWWNGPATGWS